VRLVVGGAEHAEGLFGEVVDGGVVDQVGVGECQVQGGKQGSGDGGAGQAGSVGWKRPVAMPAWMSRSARGARPRGASM
jgi:hypothetical protein